MLDDVTFDVADCLTGVVADHYVGADFLAVVVDFFVQGHFQVDLAAGEGESFGHEGAG